MSLEPFSFSEPSVLLGGKVLTGNVRRAERLVTIRLVPNEDGNLIEGPEESTYYLTIIVDSYVRTILFETFEKGATKLEITDPETMEKYHSKVFIVGMPVIEEGQTIKIGLIPEGNMA